MRVLRVGRGKLRNGEQAEDGGEDEQVRSHSVSLLIGWYGRGVARGPIPDKDPLRPTVPEVVPLIEAYYKKPRNGTGGHLHVVLDDANDYDTCIASCRDQARADRDFDGALLATTLLAMTRTQRRKVRRRASY
jgi:hypothetical protein